MRRRFALAFIGVALGTAGFLLLSSGVADASARDNIMAKRAMDPRWSCSQVAGRLDCSLAGTSRASTASVAPVAVAAPAPVRAARLPSGGAKRIEISTAEQRLRAYEGDTLVLDTPVSTGTAATPTPRGVFAVQSKEDPHWSNQFSVWMPKAMRVIGGVYIHEVPLTTDGRRIGVSEVGTPASHGCVRVPVGAAGRLYHWARIGTPVIVR
jgi:lipoprotein-anchoring transpeptidase ErfK/SrfK